MTIRQKERTKETDGGVDFVWSGVVFFVMFIVYFGNFVCSIIYQLLV